MKLNVYDNNLLLVSIIQEQFVSCYWEEGYNTVGVFTLELQDNESWRDRIKPDYYVTRTDRPTIMVIKTVEIKGGLIVASGAEAKLNLDDVAYIGVIDKNCIIAPTLLNCYESSIKYPYFAFVPSELTDIYTHQISNKSILELCQKMCQDADIGFRSIKDTDGIKIELYKPEQNPNLVFSEDYGNIKDVIILLSTMGYKNKAIVLGADGTNLASFELDDGHLEMTSEIAIIDTYAYVNYNTMHAIVDSPEDTSYLITVRIDENGHLQEETLPRARVDVDLSNGETVRELIVDARDINADKLTPTEYFQTLTERGTTKLLEATQTWNTTFVPLQFGDGYDIGDILVVYLKKYGITISARVVKFSQTEQRNQVATNITVGQLTIRK